LLNHSLLFFARALGRFSFRAFERFDLDVRNLERVRRHQNAFLRCLRHQSRSNIAVSIEDGNEPSKGLAPAIVQNLISALRELKATQTTVLLVEQNFGMARSLGDHVAVMDDGRVVHRGAMSELAEDESLQQRLLGLSLGAHQ